MSSIRNFSGWQFGWCLCIGSSCCLWVGCGESRYKTYPVRGKVVFSDGSPVHVGTVETKSREASVQATGTIQTDGTFSLTTYSEGDGAVAGQHDCVIVQFIQTENIPNYKPSNVGVVHKKHASYSSSGLTIDVSKTGPNEVLLKVEGVSSDAGHSDHDHGETVTDKQ